MFLYLGYTTLTFVSMLFSKRPKVCETLLGRALLYLSSKTVTYGSENPVFL